MKLRHLIAPTVAACALAFSGCSKSTADEQAAVESFKKEAESMNSWVKDKEKEDGKNPIAGMAVMKEFAGKLKPMRTENLPADLREAWADAAGKFGKME